jgi:hypothetical protein
MSPPHTGRAQTCDRNDALARLRDAEAQLQLAELTSATGSPEERKAAASCAVLAGIAASDAACCAKLAKRSRSQDHGDAVSLLRTVPGGGHAAANQLKRLLALKDHSCYGFDDMSTQHLLTAQRQARALVAFARKTLSIR